MPKQIHNPDPICQGVPVTKETCSKDCPLQSLSRILVDSYEDKQISGKSTLNEIEKTEYTPEEDQKMIEANREFEKRGHLCEVLRRS